MNSIKGEGHIHLKLRRRDQESQSNPKNNSNLLVYFSEPDSIFAPKTDAMDRRQRLYMDQRLRDNYSVAPQYSHTKSITQQEGVRVPPITPSPVTMTQSKVSTTDSTVTPTSAQIRSSSVVASKKPNYFLGLDVHLRKTSYKTYLGEEAAKVLPPPPTFKFVIGRGNNSQLVREILSKKANWVELAALPTVRSTAATFPTASQSPSSASAGGTSGGPGNSTIKNGSSSAANFIWQPVSNSICFDHVKSSLSHRICVNHVEKHKELSSKANLIKNLTRVCSIEHLSVFEITPLTFCINYAADNLNFERQFEQFLTTFLAHSKSASADTIAASMLRTKNYYAGFSRRIIGRAPVTNIPSNVNQATANNCLFSGLNLWIIKPADFNRGRGIRLFSTLVQLNKILQDYAEGGSVGNNHSLKSSQVQIPEKEGKHLGRSTKISSNYSSNSNKNGGGESSAYAVVGTAGNNMQPLTSAFVIQKYIEKPMLIEQRKFDIRMWVLISFDSRYFVCREGYIRTACEAYSTSESSISNAVVHLTNNAIQKNASGYGKLEDGNQLSFENFETYIKRAGIQCDFRGQVLPKIKESIALSLDAVKAKVNPLDRKFCFEILGYDFMIDSSGQPWLIEVSTNPCIEQSSAMLDKLLKRMLDDAFKLTLDKLFPPQNIISTPGTKQQQQQKQQPSPIVYPVDHISNQESIWEQLYLGHY